MTCICVLLGFAFAYQSHKGFPLNLTPHLMYINKGLRAVDGEGFSGNGGFFFENGGRRLKDSRRRFSGGIGCV